MPRSTTAWLMASVSVAFSAIRPSQMNTRLIALNIGFLWFIWGFFVFEQDLLLQDEVQLGIELLFIRRAHHGGAQLLDTLEHFGVDVEGDEVDRDRPPGLWPACCLQLWAGPRSGSGRPCSRRR